MVTGDRGTDPAGGVYFSNCSGANLTEQGHRAARNNDNVCHYCHKEGHWKNSCDLLMARRKQSEVQVKPSALAVPISSATVGLKTNLSPLRQNSGFESYLPFVSAGQVSLVGSVEKVSVNILRDTGSAHSFILGSVLPFSKETDTGSCIPVLGMGMSKFQVPVHKFVLHSAFCNREVRMGVSSAFPIKGITLILGNDLAGGRVWPDQPAQPVQTKFQCRTNHFGKGRKWPVCVGNTHSQNWRSR